MTVQRMDGTLCAGWTYVDERGEDSWLVMLRDGSGEWIQLDESGVSYHQSADQLRAFLADWQNDAAMDGDGGGPNDETVEVYIAAANFMVEVPA